MEEREPLTGVIPPDDGEGVLEGEDLPLEGGEIMTDDDAGADDADPALDEPLFPDEPEVSE